MKRSFDSKSVVTHRLHSVQVSWSLSSCTRHTDTRHLKEPALIGALCQHNPDDYVLTLELASQSAEHRIK